MSVKLRPHQEEAVAKMHNGCILYGDVGVGKTITSLAYYFARVCDGQINEWGSMKRPKDVYVITTAKVRDAKAFELQAARFGVLTDSEKSTNGVKITVDSWNNLHKYVEVSDAFFIFDEQRVVGYGAWARAFIKIAKHNEWILLSATPGDTWLDYIPVFIANGWYKHKTDFLDQHVIWMPRVKYPKVLRYQDIGTLVRRRNQVLVRMPYEKHTTRHPVDIWCDYDKELFDKAVKKRWHVYEERPMRDVSELFIVMRKIVNSDSSRLIAVHNLLQKHSKLIVFYNFDYELAMLRRLAEPWWPWTAASKGQEPWDWLLSPEGLAANQTMSTTSDGGQLTGSKWVCGFEFRGKKCEETLPCARHEGLSPGEEVADFTIAEWNGHKHEDIPQTARWLYLVQYRAGAEGWNCIETDAVCFFSQTYSYRDWWQAHGRIDRINTPFDDLYYYHLISKSPIDSAIRKALKAKKSFNERNLDVREKGVYEALEALKSEKSASDG